MYCVFAVACTLSIHTQCITLHYIILLVMAMNFSHRYSLQIITYCTSVLKCSRGALWCGPPLHIIQLHVRLVSSSCWVLHRGIVSSSVRYEMSLFLTQGRGGRKLETLATAHSRRESDTSNLPYDERQWMTMHLTCVCLWIGLYEGPEITATPTWKQSLFILFTVGTSKDMLEALRSTRLVW